jgi:hypothetical protein
MLLEYFGMAIGYAHENHKTLRHEKSITLYFDTRFFDCLWRR